MKRKFAVMTLLVLTLLVFAAPMTQAETTEVLYLANSSGSDTPGITRLFRVDLDSAASPPRANLTLLCDMDFEQVDALACSPDGTKIYAVSKSEYYNNAESALGYFDVTTNSWTPLGVSVKIGSTRIPNIVLAAFGPDGKLYVASDYTSHIYTVDLTTGQATDLGYAGVKLNGADLIFDALGNFYVFTNVNPTGTLYKITLGQPATPIVDLPGGWFTGLAMRNNGAGNFVGSRNPASAGLPGIIQEFGLEGNVQNYEMYLGEAPYTQYLYGDMSVGPLQICTKTIGYWKNHSWGGKTVTIKGREIDEKTGKGMMIGASGKNFSMLFAQLIAAKLNFSGYNQAIAIAESDVVKYFPNGWKLSDSDLENPGGEVYYKPILKSDKSYVAGIWDALDEFNNMYKCEE